VVAPVQDCASLGVQLLVGVEQPEPLSWRRFLGSKEFDPWRARVLEKVQWMRYHEQSMVNFIADLARQAKEAAFLGRSYEMLDCGCRVWWEPGRCSAREKRFTGFGGRPRSNRYRERQLARSASGNVHTQYVNWAKCIIRWIIGG
jgi:hypothetical protein